MEWLPTSYKIEIQYHTSEKGDSLTSLCVDQIPAGFLIDLEAFRGLFD